MYRVSDTISSSGAGSVPGAVDGTSTGCCSGCGGAADMMEVVCAQRRYSHRSVQSEPELEPVMLPP